MKKTNSKNMKKNKSNIEQGVPPKRILLLIACIGIVFILLIIRLIYLQFIDGPELEKAAYNQQTLNKLIAPKRGNIYDSNGKTLAISADVDTISINPLLITEKEKVATALSDIFELDYKKTLEQVKSNAPVVTIAKKVEKDKVTALTEWMESNKISNGINIDKDSKRSYPYSNLASNLIGFTGTDNNGLEGIELKWDSTLAGTAGKIVTTGDVNNDEISTDTDQYVAVENGSNLYLTLDVNIQLIVEKYLEKYAKKNDCEGGSAIIMKPSTGEILAMASYPNYDLNQPFEPNSDLKKGWKKLSDEEQSSALQNMWRNRVVSNTYEPGSTFKVLMSAIAIEENITQTDIKNDFLCNGYENVSGTEINCWTSGYHGYQTLRNALANSCNPSFIQLGQRLGISTMYKYFKAFGLFDKTNIATSGETTGLFHDKDSVGPTELATMSFGQRFTITPLQLITAACSIANDGILVQPKIVKQIENADTGAISTIDTQEVRKVVSPETAEKVLSMMESVVTDGTGQSGSVKGYTIGGKTGTSEPSPGKEEEGYVVSFLATAPSSNPEIVALVVFYNPGEKNPEGSKIAGPAMSEILSEVLPYMGITSNNIEEASNTN